MRQGLGFNEEPFDAYSESEDEYRETGEAPAASRIEDRTNVTPKSKRIKQRDPRTVNALVLHQMAFSRGSVPARYNTVTAHFAILPDGKILQLHPVSALLWASNGFNRRSVAVEFAGNLPNIKGKCWQAKTYGCNKLTPQQVEAGRYLVRYLIKKIGLKYIFAHRQAAASRENCPGPDIWYNVGQWAVDTLGLSDGGAGYKIDRGNPILPQWRTWGKSAVAPELELDEMLDELEEQFPEIFEYEDSSEEEFGQRQGNLKKTGRGYRGSGGGRLDRRLRELRASGKLSMTDQNIEMLQRIANVETGGLVQAINSYDSAYMSMGFMQWTIAHKSLQRLIMRAPSAFRRYGIEIDGSRLYNIAGKPPALKGTQHPGELRSLEWAKRFYAAGLDPEIVTAEARLALVVLQEDRKKMFKRNPEVAPYYQKSAVLRALLHETYNNRPAYVRLILDRALGRARKLGGVSTEAFLDLVRAATREVYAQKEPQRGPTKASNLITKTASPGGSSSAKREMEAPEDQWAREDYESGNHYAYS